MTPTCFDVSITDRIAHVRLNRPEALNSMTRAFWNELPEVIEGIDRAASARVIVISSTGKHFSAGMDLNVFAEGLSDHAAGDAYTRAEAFTRHVRAIQDSISSLERARIPVLCAVQGGCIGGAVDLATACDIRYATADAFFTIQEINIGMTADVGTFPRLQKLIPEGIVRELAYTGRRFSAGEALQYGLVNAVYPDAASLLERVMETAREIAAKNPLAVAGSKRAITYGRDHSTTDTLDFIGVWNASMLPPEHMREAMMAKMEGRTPNFPDLLPVRKTAF
jgi:enoyl-CoA hydratase